MSKLKEMSQQEFEALKKYVSSCSQSELTEIQNSLEEISTGELVLNFSEKNSKKDSEIKFDPFEKGFSESRRRFLKWMGVSGLSGIIFILKPSTAQAFLGFMARMGIQRASAATNYVDDVFSTYLYTGNGGTQIITNGINLSNGITVSTPGWISRLSTSNQALGYGVTVDSNANVFAVGAGGAAGGALIVKYNFLGVLQWQRKIKDASGLNAESAGSVATDSSGNIYVLGSIYVSGYPDTFIAKYNTSGVIQWQKTIDSGTNDYTGKIAVDSTGNFYVTGGIYTADSPDGWLAKYNTNGDIQWQRRLRLKGNFKGLVLDASDGVFLAGNTYDTTNAQMGFIAKYDTSGVLQWQRTLDGGAGTDMAHSISVDSSGNVYIAGEGGSSVSAFIAKYNTSGVIQWQRILDGASAQSFYDISTDSSGNSYVTGTDATNVLIAKYNTSGVIQWQKKLDGGSTSECGQGIFATTGGLYITGYIGGSTAPTDFFVAKLPLDGSGAGWAGNSVFYTTSTLTDSAGTLTDAASAFAELTASNTTATSSHTESAASINSTLTNIASVGAGGGLVWSKLRSGGNSGVLNHCVSDTTQGATKSASTNNSDAFGDYGTGSNSRITNFLNNGFSIGSNQNINESGDLAVSWTFRKAIKFFDVVTYNGNTTDNRAISHNLGVAPGLIIIKNTQSAGYNWNIWHRSLGSNGGLLNLNNTNASSTNTGIFGGTGNNAPTATQFYIGSHAEVNGGMTGTDTYIAYLFAHDTSAGGIIQCGSFTVSGNTASVNLGWEPQYILCKGTAAATAWSIFDTMRGWDMSTGDKELQANSSVAEAINSCGYPTSTGFNVEAWPDGTYIYLVIRRPCKPPTVGTQVYKATSFTGVGSLQTSGFPVDLVIEGKNIDTTTAWAWIDRLRGSTKKLESNAVNLESVEAGVFDSMTQCVATGDGNNYLRLYRMFRRAPGVFDIVCYTGTGVVHTEAHNLGVAPELMIVKSRSSADNWAVYIGPNGPTGYIPINLTNAFVTTSTPWNDTAPTASVFTIGTGSTTNSSSVTYVAYLFATKAGISKVGSYSGNGSTQTINCNFTTGARFILIKRTDSAGDWFVWDSARGIAAGNDPHLSLNTTAAEVTSDDSINPDNSGFVVNQAVATNINVNAAIYIYLAIA